MIKAFISTTIAVVSATLSEAKSEETNGKSDDRSPLLFAVNMLFLEHTSGRGTFCEEK